MKTSLLLLLLAIPCIAPLAGCQRHLFSDSDPYNRSRIRRYWNGDSAQETTANRRRANDMGFGFSAGPGAQ